MDPELAMQEMHKALGCDPTLSDDRIREVVDRWEANLQTNCDNAAQALFAVVAPVCFHRSHLVTEMLQRALRPLLYLGYEDAEQVLAWVESYLQRPRHYAWMDDVGRRWLAEQLPHQSAAV